MVGLLVFALFTIVALAAVGIVIAAYYVMRHEARSRRHRTRSAPGPQAHSTYEREELQALQARLLSMVNGDRATVQRLVSHARSSDTGGRRVSESWYWEKAIEDLIRDRR